MKFIRALIRRNKNEATVSGDTTQSLDGSYRSTISDLSDDQQVLQRRVTNADGASMTETLADIAQKSNAGQRTPRTEQQVNHVNIWDIDDEKASTGLPGTAATPPQSSPEAASAAAARSPARSRRTKTRLIGFEKSDGAVVDLFNDAPKVAPAQRAKFPVGWIVVIKGPGRGESFALKAGMSQIGRGEDQAVQLDFGDTAISRTNHAAIVYDPDSKEFLLGHGGKSNIVRLNDKPVISNEALKNGDLIRIGETILRFVGLCDKAFDWSDGAAGGDEDVAIA